MRKVILMLLLACASSSAMAEWVQIGGYGGISIYTDPTNIHKEGNIVRMWNLYNHNIAQREAGGKMYLSAEQQEEFDCKEKRMRSLYFSYHPGRMGEGDSIYSNSLSDNSKWDPIEPGSTGEQLLKYACGIK